MPGNSTHSWLAAGAALAGLYLAFLSGSRHAGTRGRISPPAHKQVFVLAVGLKFRSTEERDSWLEHWRLIAQHVRLHELRTLSFEMSVADTDNTKLLVYERYISKADYLEHRKSDAFAAFKAGTKDMAVEITGQSYLESNVGFM